MRYRLFGLSVDADRPLPTLPSEPHAGPADVRMWIGSHPPGVPATDHPWYVSDRPVPAGAPPVLVITRSADGGWLRLRYADGTEITLDRAATRVGCTWTEGCTVDDASTYLLGPVCGLLLRLRGVTCLHASAVAIGGRAVLVCGPAGMGKSTTAAALGARGHGILSDDVSALDAADGAVTVRAAYPQLKLWTDAAEAVFGDADLPRLTPNWEKRYLDLSAREGAFHGVPLPVHAVYVLAGREDDRAPRVEPLEGTAAVLGLVAHTYMDWLPDRAAQGRDLGMYGRLARTASIRRLVAHTDAARIPELCQVIEDDVARGAGAGG